MKTGDIIITLLLSNVCVISGALFEIGFKLGEKNINLGLSEALTFDVTIADNNGQIGLDLGSSGIRRHTRRHVDQCVQTQTMENTSSVGDNNAGTGTNSKTNPNSMDTEESEMISAFQFVNTVAKNVLVGTLEAATKKEPKRRGETILERLKRLEEEAELRRMAESNAADEENKVSDDVDTGLNAINSGDVVLIANPRRNINENEENRKENEKGSIGSVINDIIESNGENIVQIVLDNAEEALLDHVVPDDSTMTPREQVKRLIFTKAVDEIKEQIEDRLDLKRTGDNDIKATTEIDSNLKGPSAFRCTCF